MRPKFMYTGKQESPCKQLFSLLDMQNICDANCLQTLRLSL